MLQANAFAAGLDHVPDHVLRDAAAPHLPQPGDGSKDSSLRDTRRSCPLVERCFDPSWNGNGADVAALPDEIDHGPVPLPNLDFVQLQTDQGESAKTANRTELRKLLEYCRVHKGHVQCVVVYSVNRFAREKHDHFLLRAQLQRLGVTLRSATEPIDDSSTGKLMEGIVSAFAQFDNDNDVRSERTVQGMKARLEKGGWTFPPPLGYTASQDKAGRKTLLPDAERAQLITHAFEIFASGLYNKNQVLAIITKMGLRTKKGRVLSAQSFGQLLRKPIYAGRLVVPGWDVSHTSDFAPLISIETFKQVQALLSGKKPSVGPRLRCNPDFPLRHFVSCGDCRRPLTASWSRGRNQRYSYYRCQNHLCRAVNVRREDLEQRFEEFLGQLRPQPEYLRLFGAIIVDVWKEKQVQASAFRDAIARRLGELRSRKNLLVEAFVYKHAIDEQTYGEQLDKLNEEITLAEIEEQDARLDELDVEAAVEFAQYVLLNAPRLWAESGADQKQRLQRLIFPQGVLFSKGVYRTNATSMLFFELEEISDEKERLVALTGIEPVFED